MNETTAQAIMDTVESYPGGEEVEDLNLPGQAVKKNIFDYLTTKTGEGSVLEYLNHPLNFDQSPALARILRGITGFLGETDFALADIIIGLLEFLQKKTKKEGKEEADII